MALSTLDLRKIEELLDRKLDEKLDKKFDEKLEPFKKSLRSDIKILEIVFTNKLNQAFVPIRDDIAIIKQVVEREFKRVNKKMDWHESLLMTVVNDNEDLNTRLKKLEGTNGRSSSN